MSALITKLLESSEQLRVFQKISYIRGAYMLLEVQIIRDHTLEAEWMENSFHKIFPTLDLQ